jgi:hypothetical protein
MSALSRRTPPGRPAAANATQPIMLDASAIEWLGKVESRRALPAGEIILILQRFSV